MADTWQCSPGVDNDDEDCVVLSYRSLRARIRPVQQDKQRRSTRQFGYHGMCGYGMCQNESAYIPRHPFRHANHRRQRPQGNQKEMKGKIINFYY